jgi:hypothetical protein
MEARLHIQHRLAFEHVIDRPSQLVGQDGQGVALAVFVRQLGQELLPCRVVAQKQHGRFREGPREIGIADVLAGGAVTCTG